MMMGSFSLELSSSSNNDFPVGVCFFIIFYFSLLRTSWARKVCPYMHVHTYRVCYAPMTNRTVMSKVLHTIYMRFRPGDRLAVKIDTQSTEHTHARAHKIRYGKYFCLKVVDIDLRKPATRPMPGTNVTCIIHFQPQWCHAPRIQFTRATLSA